MARYCTSAIAAALVLAGVGGCGDTRCGGNSRDTSAGAPVIESFYVLDTQVPGDPWTVIFGVDFTAQAGTLGDGQAEFYLNNSDTPTSQGLVDVFRQSGVALTETQGSIWMALRFASNVSDGTDVRIGLQLVDPEGTRSNCYTLKLEFAVAPVAASGLRMAPHASVAACGPEFGERHHG